MIPKIIHQIWIQGYDKIPDELRDYHVNCLNVNNNFKNIFWDETKIIDLLEKHFGKKYIDLYNYYTVFSQKADLAKYAILYVHGGIYLDMDMVCRKNLMPFLKYKLFFTTDIFYNLYRRYLTGIIGAVPKHHVFLIALETMLARKPYSYNIQYSAATQLFYDTVEEYRKKTGDNDIFIVDRKYLHPCSILDDELCAYTCNNCYVAHTNYSSWSPSLKLLKFISRNIKLILLIIIIIIIILLIKCKFIRL